MWERRRAVKGGERGGVVAWVCYLNRGESQEFKRVQNAPRAAEVRLLGKLQERARPRQVLVRAGLGSMSICVYL